MSGFPNPAVQGVAGSVTVAAKDIGGITVPSYTGTVTLTNNDPSGSSPVSHTFVSGDNGVFIFSNVTLNTLGTWTITASDGLLTGSQTNIQVVLPPSSFYWTNGNGNWSAGANWTNDTGAGASPLAAGQTNYALNFNRPSGGYNATNDLNNGFLLNQLQNNNAVSGGSVFLRGNSLAFTNNGDTGPAINQNTLAKLVIYNNLAFNNNVTLGGSGGGEVSLEGVISGAGSFTITNSASAGVTFNGNNISTWTGSLVVQSEIGRAHV